MGELPEYIDGLPDICGSEPLIAETVRAARERPVFFDDEVADPLAGIEAAFAIALHMHQPLIPAGGDEVRSARLISNLQYMYEHPDLEDNHNAPVFRWCYKRMGESPCATGCCCARTTSRSSPTSAASTGRKASISALPE